MRMELLRHNPQQPFQKLTVHIVAPANFIGNRGKLTGKLTEALEIENRQNYNDRLFFMFCEHIEESIKWIRDCGNPPDFIVVVVDPKVIGLENVEDNIKRIDSVYNRGGRIALVNGACSLKFADVGLPVGHLNILCQKYSMILINGDILIPEKCLYLASRILKLATSVCGVFTGVPVVVDMPGYNHATDK